MGRCARRRVTNAGREYAGVRLPFPQSPRVLRSTGPDCLSDSLPPGRMTTWFLVGTGARAATEEFGT